MRHREERDLEREKKIQALEKLLKYWGKKTTTCNETKLTIKGR